MDKLVALETCIENDLYKIKLLEGHLNKLYEMRDKELALRGITLEEWESLK